MEDITQQAPLPVEQPAPIPLKLHHFPSTMYDEVIDVVVENNTFILQEIQKGNVVTEELLGNILRAFITQCIRKGPPAGEKLTDNNLTCKHVFKKGAPDKIGRECGHKANYTGIEGLPKCSTHKNSKATGAAAAVSSAASGGDTASFSYKNHAGSGKIAPQNLSSIQASIAEQNTPAEITLAFDETLKIYYTVTSNLVFEQRKDESGEKWIAVGIRTDEGVQKLTTMETFICWSNNWKWDPNCVDDEVATHENHPLANLAASHALVSKQPDILAAKFERIAQNSNN